MLNKKYTGKNSFAVKPVTFTKITDKAREYIFERKADGASYNEIAGEVKHNFNIIITASTIAKHCTDPENKPFIEKYRERYLANVRAVPIANKRVRLDDLEKMRNDLIVWMGEMDKKDFKNLHPYLNTVRRYIEVLDCARQEMESKPQFINNITINEYSDVTDDELVRREKEYLGRLEAGRVARITEDTEGTESTDS